MPSSCVVAFVDVGGDAGLVAVDDGSGGGDDGDDVMFADTVPVV